MANDHVNLLPKRLRTSRVKIRPALIAGWAVTLTLLAGLTLFKTVSARHKADAYAALAARAESVSHDLELLTNQASLEDKARLKVNMTKDFLNSKVSWTEPLKELSLLLPNKVWISQFSTKINDRKVPSVELTGSAPSQTKIAVFLESLEKSYYFHHVSLKKSEKLADMTPDLYQFKFEVELPQILQRGENVKN